MPLALAIWTEVKVYSSIGCMATAIYKPSETHLLVRTNQFVTFSYQKNVVNIERET